MDRTLGTDLTVGSIPRHLLFFSVPMLIGNLMQIGYSMVNTIWVGHLVGEDAVGASGVSFFVLFLLFGIVAGMSMASTILVSQYYGAKDYPMVGKVVDTSFVLALILSGIFTVAAILSCDSVLRAMDTPHANFSMASSYLKISMAGFVLMYLGFLINSILRGIGDTVTPLIFMAVGVGLNAVLDPFFIGGFGPFPLHGLDGAAYATLVSQAVALVISFMYLNRRNHLVTFHPAKLTLDPHMMFLLFKIGLPSIVQQSLVSISSLFITAFVNAFGSAATNAFGAVMRVDMLAFMPAVSLSMAVSSLTGQNLGALKPERVTEVFKWGMIMTSVITLSISLIVIIFTKPILAIFGLGDDPKVMEIGVTYLRIVGSGYIFFGIMFISMGIINGAGHTMITMVFSLLSLWAVRVPGSWILSRTVLGIKGIWIAVVFSFMVTMTISLIYYRSGRWKKTVISRTHAAIPLVD